jgi:hypothetical protein
MSAAPQMTRRDLEQLEKLAKMRAKQAKAVVDQRAKVLLLEAQEMLAAEFKAQDSMWAEAVAAAKEAAERANEVIAAKALLIGVPEDRSPRLQLEWSSRRPDKERRAELLSLAGKRVAAMAATAKTEIDGWLNDTVGELILGGLESEDARRIVEAMPTAEALMPAIGLDDLGVKGWQPPEGAAAELLAPRGASDVLRLRVLRAVEADPAASNRKIALALGIDHKTVAKYRTQSGEVPSIGGEFPTAGGGGGA